MSPTNSLGRTVRVLDEGYAWEFAGRRRPVDDVGAPVAHLDDLERCSASDLCAALRRPTYLADGPHQLWVSEGPEPGEDVEDGPVGPVSFTADDDGLIMRLVHVTSNYIDDEAELFEQTQRILAPLLARHRMWLVSTYWELAHKAGPWIAYIEISFHNRGRIVVDLVRVGLDVLALLGVADEGNPGREQIADLLRAGHAQALIGQAENHWLEAKSQHYDLNSTIGKISLAKAVARFANAEHGGLIVVGIKTKTIEGGQDVLRKVTPLPHIPGISRKYQAILKNHLYPPVDGLQIETITYKDGEFMLLHIPPQPEDLKPFLVHGAIIDGESDCTFISIVRRRGDDAIPTTPAMIHSTIAAGRALLRRGELPDLGLEARRQHDPSAELADPSLLCLRTFVINTGPRPMSAANCTDAAVNLGMLHGL